MNKGRLKRPSLLHVNDFVEKIGNKERLYGGSANFRAASPIKYPLSFIIYHDHMVGPTSH